MKQRAQKEILLYIWSMVFDKGAKNTQWGMDFSPGNDAGKAR